MKQYPMKRLFDIIVSLSILLVASPLLLGSMLAVWLQDRHSPFYFATRVSRGGGDFTMIKIRSMVMNAASSGVNSTGKNDARITAVGRFIRRYKVDELSQFLNVLWGNMSLVGPRPNTRAWGVDLYTETEQNLLLVRPGITDLASIIFSDEGEILANAKHADLEYNRIIRPWKSRLGIFYIQNMSILLDIQICWLTFRAILNRPAAVRGVVAILENKGADKELIKVCSRKAPLPAFPPPGGSEIETGSKMGYKV